MKKNYHSVRTVPNSYKINNNKKKKKKGQINSPNTHIHDCSFSRIGTGGK